MWDNFNVFMYLPYMDTEDGAYGVAEFNQKGRLDFRVYEGTLELYEIERYGSQMAVKDTPNSKRKGPAATIGGGSKRGGGKKK